MRTQGAFGERLRRRCPSHIARVSRTVAISAPRIAGTTRQLRWLGLPARVRLGRPSIGRHGLDDLPVGKLSRSPKAFVTAGRNAIATFEMRRDAVQAMPSDVGLEPPPILRPDRVGCLPRESRPASKPRGMPTDRRVGDETHASTLRQSRRRLALVHRQTDCCRPSGRGSINFC
jgi:hypothetical protein